MLPSYPPTAKMTHIHGIVEFTAILSKTGSIENLQLVRGSPLLVKAAEGRHSSMETQNNPAEWRASRSNHRYSRELHTHSVASNWSRERERPGLAVQGIMGLGHR